MLTNLLSEPYVDPLRRDQIDGWGWFENEVETAGLGKHHQILLLPTTSTKIKKKT